MGMIGTQTISRGESREGGLAAIRDQGGWIYNAKPSSAWPGIASVIIAIVHISKDRNNISPVLNDKPVVVITAFLFPGGPDHSPGKLRDSGSLVTLGSVIYGSGFLFDDSDPSANPTATLDKVREESLFEASRILPYIGGEEFNASPTHAPRRHVINLNEVKDEQELQGFPLLAMIVEAKVKPLRMSLGNNPVNKPLKRRWWAYQAHRPKFYSEISNLKRIIASSKTSTFLSFDFIDTGSIFSDKLVLFGFDSTSLLAILSSEIHEVWVSSFCPRQGSGSAYSIADGYESFPFTGKNLASVKLEKAGTQFYEERKELMRVSQMGLTKLYSAINNPWDVSDVASQMRLALHDLDLAVLGEYGLDTTDFGHGFALLPVEVDDDCLLDEEIKDCLRSGRVFFRDPLEAQDFEGSLKSKLTSSPGGMQWRFRSKADQRDYLLSRLLALNTEMMELPGAQDSQTGGSSAGSSAARRRGRPPKNPPTGSDQIGLSL